MVANRNTPRQGTVTDLITGLLDRGYNTTVQPVLTSIASSTNNGLIQRRLQELEEEAARLAEAGERLQPDNAILRALMADMDDTMRANARLLDASAAPLQQTGIDAAGRVQRQLALPGMTDAQLARVGLRWNSPDPEAVARLVNYAQSEGWAATVGQYGPDVLSIINNQAIRGVALGWNPLRTAREVRRLAENLPGYQANNLMRTLQLTSYRDSTAVHQQANIDLAQQIIRIAALDTRTCLSCVAQHGAVIWDSERDVNAPIPRVNDHHSGRCTSVMIVKGRPHNIQTGPEWFDNLPPERQRQQASFAKSPGKYDAYTSGQVRLADFVHPYRDPAFGPMLREASLSGALNTRSTIRQQIPLWTGERGGQIGDLTSITTQDGLAEWMLNNENTALGKQFWDETMGLTGYDDNWNLRLQPDGIRSAAKTFVASSQDIQYSRQYIVDLASQMARENGVSVNNPEEFYNQQFAYQAQAILKAADLANVRLTEPQMRRLNIALNGQYLDMVYTTDSSEAGSLANAARRRGSTRLNAIELKQARENFRDWVQGID
ncbi:MAG: phage head morphogenesis protein [Anaerolineae bacterium]|nr:phage head morphogenesis protein [Anaerolineae bacterium]